MNKYIGKTREKSTISQTLLIRSTLWNLRLQINPELVIKEDIPNFVENNFHYSLYTRK